MRRWTWLAARGTKLEIGGGKRGELCVLAGDRARKPLSVSPRTSVVSHDPPLNRSNFALIRGHIQASLVAQQERICLLCRWGFNPWIGKIPGEGNGYPLQYSCLKNPWTEEPGGLWSTGSQRVGHDWACTHEATFIICTSNVKLSTMSETHCWVLLKQL